MRVLVAARRSPPQPAAARRSPPQPAAPRVAVGAKQNIYFFKMVACCTQLDANSATLLGVVRCGLSVVPKRCLLYVSGLINLSPSLRTTSGASNAPPSPAIASSLKISASSWRVTFLPLKETYLVHVSVTPKRFDSLSSKVEKVRRGTASTVSSDDDSAPQTDRFRGLRPQRRTFWRESGGCGQGGLGRCGF